jgi:hypothetical protein
VFIELSKNGSSPRYIVARSSSSSGGACLKHTAEGSLAQLFGGKKESKPVLRVTWIDIVGIAIHVKQKSKATIRKSVFCIRRTLVLPSMISSLVHNGSFTVHVIIVDTQT